MRKDGMTPTELDDLGKAMARWLAPYLVDELSPGSDSTSVMKKGSYDNATALDFVNALGDTVLENAEVFFRLLDEHGEVGSLSVAEAIAVGSPRNIAAVLTTPLKRRAKTLGLPYPWEDATSHDDRTIWIDRDGVARLLLDAVATEKKRRAERNAG
jgi:hypothetical protein